MLGLELTPAIAEALYTALVTDTGRFQYSNTTPKALRLAADLVEAGADPSKESSSRSTRSTPFAKLKLLARALERAQIVRGRPRSSSRSSSARTSRMPRCRASRRPKVSSTIFARLRVLEVVCADPRAPVKRLLLRAQGLAARVAAGRDRRLPRSRVSFGGGGHRRWPPASRPTLPMDEIVRRGSSDASPASDGGRSTS